MQASCLMALKDALAATVGALKRLIVASIVGGITGATLISQSALDSGFDFSESFRKADA